MPELSVFPYYPERVLAHYRGVAELLLAFQTADFDQFADPIWLLRDAIRARNLPCWPSVAQTYAALEDEVQLLQMLVAFCRARATIYPFDTQQPRPLPAAVLDELRWSDLRHPDKCCYIHWGLLRDVRLPAHLSAQRYGWAVGEEQQQPDSFLEGAFVRTTGWGALEVLLVFRAEDEPAPGLASMGSTDHRPVVLFSIDKASKPQPADRLDSCVLSFADVWDAANVAGELEIGVMRKLLRTRNARMSMVEREQYQLLMGAVSHLLPCLSACLSRIPVHVDTPYGPAPARLSVRDIKP